MQSEQEKGFHDHAEENEGDDEKERREYLKKAEDIFLQIVPRAQRGILVNGYAVGDYTDEKGRSMEVRLSVGYENPPILTLNANTGDYWALPELYKKMTEAGIKIDRIVSYEVVSNGDQAKLSKIIT